MRDHVVGLAVDFFLARAVEVKLLEHVAFTIDANGAGIGGVNLDAVTVVDNRKRRALVGKLDRREIGLDRLADVDRRLALAETAGGVILVERPPFVRAAIAAVAPVRRWRRRGSILGRLFAIFPFGCFCRFGDGRGLRRRWGCGGSGLAARLAGVVEKGFFAGVGCHRSCLSRVENFRFQFGAVSAGIRLLQCGKLALVAQKFAERRQPRVGKGPRIG